MASELQTQWKAQAEEERIRANGLEERVLVAERYAEDLQNELAKVNSDRDDDRREFRRRILEHTTMDAWWTASGDDWPIPEGLPSRFVAVVLARAEASYGE